MATERGLLLLIPCGKNPFQQLQLERDSPHLLSLELSFSPGISHPSSARPGRAPPWGQWQLRAESRGVSRAPTAPGGSRGWEIMKTLLYLLLP